MNKLFVLLFVVSLGNSTLAQQVVRESREINTDSVSALISRSNAYKYSDPPRALKLSIQAESYAKKSGKGTLIAWAYSNTGDKYKIEGLYGRAEKKYLEELTTAQEINDSDLIADAYTNLGLNYHEQAQYGNALSAFLNSEKINAQRNLSENLTRDYNNIGRVYYYLNQNEEALNYFTKAIELAKQIGDSASLATYYNNVANVYAETGNTDKALQLYKSAISIDRVLEDYFGLGTDLNNLGSYFTDLHLFDSAQYYFNRALVVRKNISDTKGQVSTTIDLANLMIESGESKEALKSLWWVKKIADKRNYTTLKADVFESLNTAHLALHNMDSAYYYLERKYEARDELNILANTRQVAALQTRSQIEMEALKQEKIQQEKAQKEQAEQNRRQLIQYSGIFLFVILLFGFIFLSRKVKISDGMVNGLMFFTFLLLFEFILVILDPHIDNWTNNQPAYKLLINAILALIIIPFHNYFEKYFRKKILHLEPED